MDKKGKPKSFARYVGILSVIVTIVAIIVTIITFSLGKTSDKTEVSAQVLSNDELTIYSSEAELKGTFTYAGEEVAHLWKITLQFTNSGDRTIVGEGNLKNILSDGLNFAFPENTRILRVVHTVTSETIPSEIVLTSTNLFQIRFPQWRAGEYILASFYISSETALETDPLPFIPSRDIIDGDVIVKYLRQGTSTEPISIIDRMPKKIAAAGKIIGGIIAGIFAFAFLYMIIDEGIKQIRFYRWKANNLTSFVEYLDSIEPTIPDHRKKILVEKPYMLEEILWDKFGGRRVPIKDLMAKGIPGYIFSSLVFLFIAFGSVCLILMLFPA